ncbi:spermidine synthase [Streptomyces candidus]|uniref:Polyamine aminopropyltransferase n=1 Tax=Streptomyces candidus TaxID=67283 RepID=A0A7X0HI97_9ACTN|nr:spermidine synthase [Streptomyces candidus]MBB6438141.1 spermidine synthase [Streptomyces candidus]GHH39139.1 polyamine aminopropyltransferase 2 [Streptomyces candidus]
MIQPASAPAGPNRSDPVAPSGSGDPPGCRGSLGASRAADSSGRAASGNSAATAAVPAAAAGGGTGSGGVPPQRRTEAVGRLPVRPRLARFLVLGVVFVCAACGLVYELELVALASYLIGDSVTQASVVLSTMVFAMGVGSLLAKRLRCRAAVGFGLLEAGLAAVGGSSALVLYASFAWFGGARYVLVAFSLAIGVLIGAEIPLLMTLIQWIGRQDRGGGAPAREGAAEARGTAWPVGTAGAAAGTVPAAGTSGGESAAGAAGAEDDASGDVADLFAADYVGALVGGLAFPFLLLPMLGQLTGALVTGAINTAVGGALVLWLFRRELTRRERWLLVLANVAVLAGLATATVLVDDFERAARRAVYGDRVRVAVQTDVQEVVITGGPRGPLDLFLDGRLRVSGRDEHRYHEALVHPAMRGGHARVLILGGGDGLAAREVLRYPDVRSLTLVELDPGVVELARTDPALSVLNGGVHQDPRLHVVHADAFQWLRSAPYADPPYDVVISDLPDPGITASTKLYSQEFYGLAADVLTPRGRIVVHAGPIGARPRVYWTVDATLRAAGLATRPYRATGRFSVYSAGPDRSSGNGRAPRDWGLILAAPTRPALDLPPDAPALRALTPSVLREGARSAEESRVRNVPASTLVHPRYAH